MIYTRHEIIYVLRCIKKFNLKSTHLSEALEDILTDLSFDHEDVLNILKNFASNTEDSKLKVQLDKGINDWSSVPVEAPIIEEDNDSPI